MSKLFQPIRKYISRIMVLIATLVIVLAQTAGFASAQTPDDLWTPHLNLSNTGSTIEPVVVSDSEGRIHVLWQDTFAGFVYTKYENDQWSQPLSVEFPFSMNRILYKPALVASNDGYVYATWVDDRSDLWFSRVLGQSFGESSAWEAARNQSSGISNFVLAIDETNVVHLAYLKTEETADFSAGIYYLQSRDGGRNWSAIEEIYTSPYLRSSISTSDIESTLSIATANSGDVQRVYLTWDNRPLKRIFLDISNDGGVTWQPAIEIDAPDLVTGAASSFDMIVGADGNNAHLIWQKGEPASSCDHYYQWTSDGGATWSERLQMPAQLVGCAEEQKFIFYRQDFALLQKTIDNQVYFLAWNGEAWSEPQLQDSLISFVDPITLEIVEMGCRNYDFLPARNLISVVGCDRDGAGDIWFTNRSIASVEELFPPPPIWSSPAAVASSVGEIQSPILLTDSKGLVHLVWLQTDEISPEGAINNIYYAQWSGGSWTLPLAPFEENDDTAVSLSAAIGMNDILYLTWSDRNATENYFTWANSEQAIRAIEWAEIQLLPYPQQIGSSPEVFIDQAGTLFVTTEIPINERRGVYLIRSTDLGQSWSNPIQVVDATNENMPVVAEASLNGLYDGSKHMIWTQYSIPGGPGPEALYYARSVDNGETWSDPVLVVNGPVTWSRILGFGDSVIHVVWQEFRSGRPVIRHQFSQDSGVSWSPIATISNFENAIGHPSITIDPVGQLHIIQILNEIGDELDLKHWVWDGERWITSDGADLGTSREGSNIESAVMASILGELNVVYSGKISTESVVGLQNDLLSTYRTVTLPDTLPSFTPALTPLPTELPAPTSVPELTSTSIPTPTLAVVPTLEPESDASSAQGSINITGLALAFGGALAIIIIILFVVFRLRGNII